MTLRQEPIKRKTNRGNESGARLFNLLSALGFHDHERVSINTRLPDGPFTSALYEVRDLEGWSPPQDRDVWFGVNPISRHVRCGRGTEADLTRVRTLFADLDVKHGKQFDTLEQCHQTVELLEETLGARAVALVESGHGLQPLWRIGSPSGDSNVIGRDRTRDEWKVIHQRWGTAVQNAARQVIWSPDGAQNVRTIDNVFELARVLRCPGSVNWKNPDEPVPVRTRLFDHAGRVRPAALVAVLDRRNFGPLASVRLATTRVATSWADADEWIANLPGAELDLDALQLLPRGRVLADYLDLVALFRILADGRGAYETMRDKVLHAVLSAQEGRGGLAVALNNLRDAYLEVMEARSRGELPGEVRSVPVALDEFHRAVVGAVARARGRTVPNVDGWSPVVIGGSSGQARHRQRYRPEYRPRWMGLGR